MDLKRQASAPLYEAIEKFRKKRIVPFDVPGHKRGRGNPELVDLLGERCVGIDVNSMKPLDNLCHPVSVIKEAEELTAEAFGAEHAFFMVGGTTQAVQNMVLSVCKAGDEIIVPEPAYANYMAFAISAGAKIRTIATTIEEGFSLPKVEKFEELINERTKAILICNPNNPTGYLYTRREMNQIRDLVKKYDLFLFSDEVYREFIYTGSPYISACHLEGIENNVVLIDSVSKRYSECGIRIGALITKNKEIRDAVMKFCQARLSPPLIGQIAAEASLDAPEEYYRETYDEYVERRKCLIDGLNRIPGVYSPIPMGAFYTVAKLPVDDSDKFCAWCLSDFEYEGQTVFMAPASGFYTTPGSGINEVRIAYVLKKEDLTRALFVLQKALEAYPGRVD